MPSLPGIIGSARSNAWYDNWAAAYARAQAGNGQAHIVCFGDSVSQGYYSDTPYYLYGWAGRINTEIAARTGQTSGTGIVRFEEEFETTDDRTSVTGTWLLGTDGGFYSKYRGGDGADTYTLGPVTCTSFKIMYLTIPGGGSFTVTIDGDAPTVVSTNGANGVVFAEYSAGASGAHTMVIGVSSGSVGMVAVEAIRNSTTGVKVSRIALSGAECSQIVADADGKSSRQSYLLTDPDLAIIEFGLNEAYNGTTTATFKTNMRTLMNDMRNLGASILVVAAPPPNASFISSATWTTFRTAMSELAAEFGAGFLDMTDYWTSYAANTVYYHDNVHPSPAGHADMARIVADYVVETVAPSTPSSFVPTDISNLALWLDASHDASFSYSSGAIVSAWNDRSGNARHFTTINGSPDRSGTVFGRKAVKLDGVSAALSAGDTLDLGTSSFSIFAVVKRNSTNQGTIIGKYKVSSTDGEYVLLFDTNQLQTVYDPGTLSSTLGTASSSLDSKVVGTIVDRAAGTVTQRTAKANDGTNTFTPDSASNRNTARSLWLGGLRNSADSGFFAGYFFNGYVCEIVIYLKALNSTERDQVEAYLASKWRIL